MTPDYILLYVDSAENSATFYQEILETRPVERSPTFALFVLPNQMKLGLWSRDTVMPAANPPGGSEVAFSVESRNAVDALHERWTGEKRGVLQPPVEMDFGYTFVGLDPDGHRLRIFSPAAMA